MTPDDWAVLRRKIDEGSATTYQCREYVELLEGLLRLAKEALEELLEAIPIDLMPHEGTTKPPIKYRAVPFRLGKEGFSSTDPMTAACGAVVKAIKAGQE